MRLMWIIVALCAIGVARVHLQRMEIEARHEIQKQHTAQVDLRRTLWDQQVDLGYLTAPAAVNRRAEEMSLDLSPKIDEPRMVLGARREADVP